MRSKTLVTLMALLSVGCTSVSPATRKPAATHSATPTSNQTAQAVLDATRVIAQVGQPVQFVGKVKLLSDQGGGLISNNGGGIIANNGGGLVSDHGGGIIANNSGGVVSKTKFTLLEESAPPPPESLLTDAQVEVLDAAGRVLVGPDGKPLSAVTDGTGNYRFKAVLPDENLIVRVKLAFDPSKPGQLRAMLPRDTRGDSGAVDINTASSLGTSYVLDHYVKNRQSIYDRLPGAEAQRLSADIEKARGLISEKALNYQPDALVATAETLRSKAPDVDKTLHDIEAILLAGQSDLGIGLKATQVPLTSDVSLAFDAKGQLLIGEYISGRVRRVDADGTIRMFLDEKAGEIKRSFAALSCIRLAADGSVYGVEIDNGRVRRITPDGAIATVVGGDGRGFGAVGGVAAQTQTFARSIAFSPDGVLYVGDGRSFKTGRGRVLYVDPDGRLQEVPTTAAGWNNADVSCLEFGPDGALYALLNRQSVDVLTGEPIQDGTVARLKKGETNWSFLGNGLSVGEFSGMTVASDGSIFVSESKQHRIWRVGQDGGMTIIAGTGRAGYLGDGGSALKAQFSQPAGLLLGPDGTLYVADMGNSLVRAIESSGVIKTVAGVPGGVLQGDATTIAVANPTGVAYDSHGRLVFAEAAGHTVKRLENGRLSVIAGSSQGYDGDGGPATEASLDSPINVVYVGDDLFVVDGANKAIRKVDASGTISTVAGGAPKANRRYLGITPMDPREVNLDGISGLAVAPDHTLYWSCMHSDQIMRLRNGKVELVAGQPSPNGDKPKGGDDVGDERPAIGATLLSPFSLAFGPDGDLYFADAGNLRVRKVSGLETDQPTIHAVAGMLQKQTALALFAESGPVTSPVPGAQAAFAMPLALCFSPDGNLFVAEAGTTRLAASPRKLDGLDIEKLPAISGRVRKIDMHDPNHTVTLVAGPGARLLPDDSGDNSVSLITGLAFDAQGRLVVVDAVASQIKVLPKGTY